MTEQIGDKKDEKMDLWKDYTDKANNFADWFTAIIISNFVYLIRLTYKNEGIESLLLKENMGLWRGSFLAASVALILIFFLKVLGVWTAKMRVNEGSSKCEHNIESARDIISIFFVVLGVFSLILSSVILSHQLS